MIALIDADVLLYRIGFTTENDPEPIARIRVDDLVDSILVETGAEEYELWLSDNSTNNFRYAITPTYKANRTQPRPKHYEFLKEHLVKEWGARIAYGMEADDALGIAQDKLKESCPDLAQTVICSIDKDLLQVPGMHYNFVKKEWQAVETWAGIKWFYKQLLIGDTSDNISGCKGIGPVKAGKALDQIGPEKGERILFETVVKLYENQETEASRQEILDHILLAGRLLKIKTTEEEPLWNFPEQLQTVESPLLSTPVVQEVPIQSTEHTTQESTDGSLPHGEVTEPILKDTPPFSI